MRTIILIDDKLMEDTLRAPGLKTKREAVELDLLTLIRVQNSNPSGSLKASGIGKHRRQSAWTTCWVSSR